MPSAQYHPCYSGLQVQGTANTPAARVYIVTCFGKNVNGGQGIFNLGRRIFKNPPSQIENPLSPIDIFPKTRYNIDSCSRGVSGTLYLQSAIAGVILRGGHLFAELPLISGAEAWVLRDGNP